MKKFFLNLAICTVFCSSASFAQNNCTIDVSIAPISRGDAVPEAINTKVEAKLTQAMGKAGLTVAPYDSRFFVAARFDDAFNDVTGGPSQKTYVKTTVTLFIGDADDQKVFASESFELSGVGSTEQMAYTKALGKLSASNPQLLNFLEKGQKQIIEYYDAHYKEIINKAQQAKNARNYSEALYYASSIPSCCVGYSQAHNLTMSILNDSRDYEGQMLLAKARAAWAANPTADGAAEAHNYLSQIDPASSCFGAAQSLNAEMTKTTKQQWEFENVTKYNNEIALEKQRINAAKEAAVAYAKSRPKVVNRYVFLRRW